MPLPGRDRVDELVGAYEAPVISEDVLREFEGILEREAERAGCPVGLWTGARGLTPASRCAALHGSIAKRAKDCP